MVAAAAAPDEGRNKSSQLSKRNLSSCRTDLLKLMQNINFGRIEHLTFAGAEPVLDRTIVVREHKFGGENGSRAELAISDFLLKQQVVELFAFFDHRRDGVIDVLEIKHGLPFKMIVTEVLA